MAIRKTLDGKPNVENQHVRFDGEEAASTATPRQGSLLYKLKEIIKSLMTKIKQLVSRKNMEELCSKAKELASKENVSELKQNVVGLRTSDGRRAAIRRISSLSVKNKVLLVCVLLVLLCVLFKCVLFVGGVVWGTGERVSVNGVSVDMHKLSSENLDEAFLDSYEVPVGTVFDHDASSSVRIMNVVDSGVLVHYVKGRKRVLGLNIDVDEEVSRIDNALGRGGYNKIIHIETDPSRYTDGNELREGIYVRTGSYKYNSKMGVRKVESYLDISSDELKKKISEYRRKLDEVEAKKLMSSEGNALEIDLDIKTFCGFVMGGTPGQNWHLFTQSKDTPYYHKKGYQEYRQSGSLITPFRQFKEACATYTCYDGVNEHLYEVELHAKYDNFGIRKEEIKNVKLLLEKKFGIRMVENSHPRFGESTASYVWKSSKGEELMLEGLGTRIYLILTSDVVKSKDEYTSMEKENDKEKAKILPADKGIEVL